MAAFFLLFVSFLQILGQAGAASNSCYYPDGSIASSDSPCNSTASATDASLCCPAGWACLSNSVCMSTPESTGYNPQAPAYGRGSCTDQSWGSSACPYFCDQGNDAKGAAPMSKCPSNTNDTYCCNSEPLCNCAIGDNTIDFTGYYIVETTIGAVASSTSKTTSSSPSSSTSPSSSMAISTSSTDSVTTTSAETSTSTPASSTNQAVIIGLGVGIPLAVFAIAGALYLFHRHRQLSRRRQIGKEAETQAQNQAEGTFESQDKPPLYSMLKRGETDATTEVGSGADVHELDSPQIHEIDGQRIHELE
ncbi:hypothetical protein BDZ45DRAFT_750030 [Acephala macrosclerotiorum]|nr:hypothetical protein BDZ45DRAFT_750030 [Acephala macrosclerotiorum]